MQLTHCTISHGCCCVKEQHCQLSFLEIDLDKGSGRAVVRNSFEARKSVSNNVGCRFLANLIAGFIGELFNKNVIVKEKSCAAKGDDHCEFKF